MKATNSQAKAGEQKCQVNDISDDGTGVSDDSSKDSAENAYDYVEKDKVSVL